MTDHENKFGAFLGFSQLDNCAQRADAPATNHVCWGDWLEAALKSFAIPAEFIGQVNGRGEIIPERIEAVFRAEPALPEAATLSAESRTALEQSICLIVICSPRSAKSIQVNEAVRYFKQRGRGNYILPIVVAGEPNVSDGNSPDLSADNECFVPALRHPVSPEGTIDTPRRAGKSIFVDARHGVEKREVLAKDNRHAEADLEMAKIQLIALLLGVGFNGLWWREQKRHYFDLAEAQQQIQVARQQVAEVQGQLQIVRQEALAAQNLPRDVQAQIEAAESQALVAQNEARTAQSQLQEFQQQVRETQLQLAEARQRALVAESKILEVQAQARKAGNQIEATRAQNSETPDTQSQIKAAQYQVEKIKIQSRNARWLTKVFALLATLALLAAGIAANLARQQSKVAAEALAKAAATSGFDLTPSRADTNAIRQVLQNIAGAEQVDEQQHRLDALAVRISVEKIPEALKASAAILNDTQRSHFQKWLLVRLGWENPVAAMNSASAITGNIVNDAGASDSNSYFQLAVLDNWMQTDLSGAINWAVQLPDAGFQKRALEKIADWLKSQPDTETNVKALATCQDELAKINYSDTMDVTPEIMQPLTAPWPWSKFHLTPTWDGATLIPFANEGLSATTNSAAQSQPQ